MEREIMIRLISAAKKYGQEVSLFSLRKALQKIDFNDQEMKMAKKLVAVAHLASFNNDGREIMPAIEYFSELREWNILGEILRITKLYGHMRGVLRIREIGILNNIDAIKVDDFAAWFAQAGIKWFDIYHDEKNGLAFVDKDDLSLIYSLVEKNYEPDDFWKKMGEEIQSDGRLSIERKELIQKIASKIEPVTPIVPSARQNVETAFFEYCREKGLKIIRTLQEGQEGIRRSSYVYLVLDTDGIIKIFKEVLDYKRGRLGAGAINEDEVYEKYLSGYSGSYYLGTVNVTEKLMFIRLAYGFETPLSEIMQARKKTDAKKAYRLISEIAKQVLAILEVGILYLDLKPENILVGENQTRILDFGVTRVFQNDEKELDTLLLDPRYGTPECAMMLRASEKSAVFQLGVILCELLFGKHPFVIDPSFSLPSENREKDVINFFWPNIVCDYDQSMLSELEEKDALVIKKMLAKNPDERLSLKETVEIFSGSDLLTFPVNYSKVNPKEKNIILFPARMGIPHKGHIEYISRLIKLGFHVQISLQRSFTLTQRDPLPKWLVMKMVAHSLMKKGHRPENFSFMFTPFYRTEAEMKMHFVMMPDYLNVVGIASSNPGIRDLFHSFQIFDQKTVFGKEGSGYEDRTWGEKLRQAVRSCDHAQFDLLSAAAVEEVMPLAEIKKIYADPLIEFIPGKVEVVLLDENDSLIVHGRIIRYCSPEESLVIHLINNGVEANIADPYAKDTKISIGDSLKTLKYVRTEFDGTDEKIIFKSV
jgi:serine/threonine protein kinase